MELDKQDIQNLAEGCKTEYLKRFYDGVIIEELAQKTLEMNNALAEALCYIDKIEQALRSIENDVSGTTLEDLYEAQEKLSFTKITLEEAEITD